MSSQKIEKQMRFRRVSNLLITILLNSFLQYVKVYYYLSKIVMLL